MVCWDYKIVLVLNFFFVDNCLSVNVEVFKIK